MFVLDTKAGFMSVITCTKRPKLNFVIAFIILHTVKVAILQSVAPISTSCIQGYTFLMYCTEGKL